MPMLDFRVETFLAVCRHMNFTKAARELNITQPAVSHHMHYLEQAYGTARDPTPQQKGSHRSA